jgi:RHS repeat-associated protein
VSLSSAADGYAIADAVKFVGANAGFDTAAWRPNLTGTYAVYAQWSAYSNRATDATYTIAHASGQSSVAVNQQANGGAWNLLGTYTLTAQSAISLSSQANGYVIADAIRLVPTTSNQPAELHYVHTDHLGTPRAVVSNLNQVLWRWDGEAFGNSPADEDHDANSIPLAYNLRFPGQYFDRETNTHYNYFRDYDPNTGRYVQSDPIGLQGGLNTYSYAESAPNMLTDPLGLWVKRCSRLLGDPNNATSNRANLFRHDYLNVSSSTLSFMPRGSILLSQGQVLLNSENPNRSCSMVCDDPAFDAFVYQAATEIGEPMYCIAADSASLISALGLRNCQSWVDNVLALARQKYLATVKCPKCFR